MMHRSLLLSLALTLLLTSQLRADDWAQWRGPESTGVSRDKNLPDKMGLDPAKPDSNLLWKQPFGGRSAPIVMNGRVYIINGVGSGVNEQERVMCFDEKTGQPI